MGGKPRAPSCSGCERRLCYIGSCFWHCAHPDCEMYIETQAALRDVAAIEISAAFSAKATDTAAGSGVGD